MGYASQIAEGGQADEPERAGSLPVQPRSRRIEATTKQGADLAAAFQARNRAQGVWLLTVQVVSQVSTITILQKTRDAP